MTVVHISPPRAESHATRVTADTATCARWLGEEHGEPALAWSADVVVREKAEAPEPKMPAAGRYRGRLRAVSAARPVSER